MLVVDFDGKVLEGDGQPPSEIPIHIEILKARPDVQAVLHSHMELAIAFTMMEGVTLQPMRARASRWKSGIPTDPDPSHIKTTEQGRALAKTLGPHHAVLMRAHGLTLVAESAQALFIDAVHFKENATAQMQALQAGAKPLPLTEAEIEQIEKMEMRDWHIKKLWNYYVRKGLSEGVLPQRMEGRAGPEQGHAQARPHLRRLSHLGGRDGANSLLGDAVRGSRRACRFLFAQLRPRGDRPHARAAT